MKPPIRSDRQNFRDSIQPTTETHATTARRKREEAEQAWSQVIAACSIDDLPLLTEPTGDTGGDLPDVEPFSGDPRSETERS